MEAASTSWRSLGELFVERGLISEADLERALAEQVATKRRLADILVHRGLVTGQDITNALMEQLSDKPAAKAAVDAAVTAAPKPAAPRTGEVVQLSERAPVPEPEPAPSPEPQQEVPDPVVYGLAISAQALIAEADSRRRVAEAELAAEREAHAQVLRGLEQVGAELEARDLSTEGLTRELEETQARLRAREDELSGQVSTWEQARREAVRAGGQLAELRVRLEEKEHELSEAGASAAAWAARAVELEAESDSLSSGVTAAEHALEVLANTSFAANGTDLSRVAENGNGAPPGQAGVLYFVPDGEGYDLVERDGPLPSVGAALEFGDQRFVVTKLGRSTLPFDRRSCVFLTAL